MKWIDRGPAGDEILVCGKAPAALRLKHLVGEDVLLGNIPIRFYLRRIDVLIRPSSGFSGAAVASAFQIEAVHLAVVVVANETLPRMTEIANLGEIDLLELNGLPVRSLSRSRAVGARKRSEKIIEAAILLNHEDHVTNRIGARRQVWRRDAVRRIVRNDAGTAARNRHAHRRAERRGKSHGIVVSGRRCIAERSMANAAYSTTATTSQRTATGDIDFTM